MSFPVLAWQCHVIQPQKARWPGPWPARFLGLGPGQMAHDVGPMSYGLCPMSYGPVLYPMAYVLLPMSYVLCPMFHVLYPMSCGLWVL